MARRKGTISKAELDRMKAELLEKSKRCSADQSYIFQTAFKRYEIQLEILERLEEEIAKGDTLVRKEYVKGRENVYTNPAITEYNKTATAANQTAQTLLKVIREMNEVSIPADEDDNL